MTRRQFQLNTEPHVAEIGPHKFEFKPEVYSDELLDSWVGLQAVLNERAEQKSTDPSEIRDMTKRVNEAVRSYLGTLMLPESEERFREVPLPDRVIIELEKWTLEVYGLRPTGPSSDFSESSSTTEADEPSSGGSSPEESTP